MPEQRTIVVPTIAGVAITGATYCAYAQDTVQATNSWVAPVLLTILGFGLGTVAGYLLAQRGKREVLHEAPADMTEAQAFVYHPVFERLGVPLLLFDRHGTLLAANRPVINLLPFPSPLGMKVQDLLPPAGRHIALEFMSDIDSRWFPDSYMGDMDTRDGRRTILWRMDAVRDGRGKIVAVFGLGLNITEWEIERLRTEAMLNALEARVAERTAALEAANQELESFSYTVSHDLRAPLQTIVALTETLQMELGEEAEPGIVSTLELITEGSLQMGRLVDALLDLSRLARRTLAREQCDTNAVVDAVWEELQASRGNRDLRLVKGKLPPCNADPVLLRQIFANLLSNAVKFTGTRERAIVEAGSTVEDGVSVYWIRDNGIGFPPSESQRIFAPFRRQANAAPFPGEGIGLATVQRIVVRHGGRIWAECVPEKHTTFYFSLGNGTVGPGLTAPATPVTAG